MQTIRNGSAGALLLAAHACALGQSAPDPASQAGAQPVQQVVVSAGADAQRLQSTTTAIVVRRDELLRHGDATLADVLKRQPGITLDASPGKAPAIRMRGMGSGYVAILLNGVPAPSGFALESLTPDMVERIEIGRVATAETSGQAVAGTINVILRRAGPAGGAAADEVKAGSAFVDGSAAPQLTVQHDGRRGALAYTLAATLRRTQNPVTALVTEEGAMPALLRRTAWFDHQVDDLLELAPRLSWQADARDTLAAQAYVRWRHIHNAMRQSETTEIGSPTAFPRAAQRYETRPLHAYADLAWTRKLDGGARLAAKLSGFHTARDADFLYRGMDASDALLATHRVASGPVEREWTFSGSWRRPLWRSHMLAAGWEAGRKARSEYRRERQTDAGGALLLASDEDYRARVVRAALFVQDEWDIDDAWSAYAGLRREDLRTSGAGNAHAAVDVHAGAWSPILQVLFKPRRPDGARGDDGDDGGGSGDEPRDGFRFAVSRTYKAPEISRLMPRRYTVDNNNSATNPDQQGNPNLRPELALGIDLAWERSVGKDGMLSVSAFHKRIRDITLVRIYRSNGVWIATPDNQGGATVRGIEFEGKATRGALSGRVNLARNWSHVDSLPQPGNRIEGQPAWSGNLGLDYASARRLDLGATYTYRGRVASRSGALFFSDDAATRRLDLVALWKRDARSRLRLSVADLLHRDVRERLAYQGDSALVSTTVFRTHTTWRLVWEQSL
ncbi:TonB-dependent receptor [Massilia forsythiae]|uniref:TonB-dependent receptor n=1 Tax=Massilia forsythiae TaxID=2728020 RepID=A0A7Z2ZUY5_9BURK|nr:TonB-dependent receptor [Massilia forsythiae]QJE02785.1 TonB-dependent receptor [Massilia forsythiae]